MEKSKIKTKNGKKMRDRDRKLIEAAVMTAVFTAMAVVLKSVTKINVPILGAGGMVINFAGIFSFFPAIMYGPIYGGVSSALCDILGYIIAPTGPYNPMFTLVAFLGGILKGVVWMLIAKGLVNKTAVKSVLAGLFAALIVVGTVFTVSLTSDGVINSAITKQEDLPFKDEISKMELSPVSEAAVALAQYNNDTITVTGVVPNKDGAVTLPAYLEVSGMSIDIKKINAEVFNTEGLKTILVPDKYTSIIVPKDFEFTNTELTIITSASATELKKFAAEYNIKVEDVEYDYLATAVDSLGLKFGNDYFSFSSGDNYRKYLSGYINFTTIGFILSGSLGLLIMLIGFILSKFGVFKHSEKSGIYLRVLPTLLLSGLVVTTINTFVLLETVTSYQGRLFWVFYTPRLAEEIFISIVQAYAITILITALSTNKSFSKLIGIAVEKPSTKKKEKNEKI